MVCVLLVNVNGVWSPGIQDVRTSTYEVGQFSTIGSFCSVFVHACFISFLPYREHGSVEEVLANVVHNCWSFSDNLESLVIDLLDTYIFPVAFAVEVSFSVSDVDGVPEEVCHGVNQIRVNQHLPGVDQVIYSQRSAVLPASVVTQSYLPG